MQRLLAQLNSGLFRLIPLVLIPVLVISIIVPSVVQANPDWYDPDWQYRKKITINKSNVSGSLSDFPVLISLTDDSDLASNARDDGYDILFTDDDEVTKFSHEIESFNGTSGHLVAWVKIPNLSSSFDTDIYMYYGNAGAGNQEDTTGVWDSNFVLVDHMQDDPDASHTSDSTSNDNDGTKKGSGEPAETTGDVGEAQLFDGDDDYIQIVDSAELRPNLQSFTLEAVIKPDLSQDFTILDKFDGNGGWTFLVTTAGRLALYYRLSGVTYYAESRSGEVADDTWQHVCIVLDRDSNLVKYYVDGDWLDQDDSFTVGSLDDTDELMIGWANDWWTWIAKGIIDEVRISNTTRSDDWIKTSYNNQNNPSDFFTLGSEAPLQVPTTVGGIVLPVNKSTVLVPWLFLFLILSLVIVRIVFRLRKKT